MQLNPNDKKISGLTSEEAQKRIEIYGNNELTQDPSNSRFAVLLKAAKDPMGLMMLGLAIIYFLLGERSDAIILLVAYVPITAIDVYLGARAERAISVLKSTFQPTAKVFRDGVLKDLPIREVVPGDFIALEEGQTIPADGIVTMSSGLRINEASLTGESEPVDKLDLDELKAGTNIINGRGIFEVQATGLNTKFGKIAGLLKDSKEELSPLQRKVNTLVKQIIRLALVLVVFLFITEMIRGKTVFQSLLIALTFGMAAVPEEFPLVFTLYLSLGAWRLAKNGVLVKSLPSVETLGSVDVICTDKTGTLTEGKFQLNELLAFSQMETKELWTFALFACEPVITDSMERAIYEKTPVKFDESKWTLLHDYPFEVEGKHMSHAWQAESGETLVAMKGAIEGVLAHCKLTDEVHENILSRTKLLASEGYRLLGLAGKSGPITGIREQDEQNLRFLGILTFSDPIRSSAKEAVQTCQREGIVVKMITGDHPLTAHAIADQLGLEHSHDALYTGTELNQLSSESRIEAFRTGAIFSRVTPEQKYELVKVLKDQGKIVAMTGDGVNDAPALKIADIGISMGENATDTARATAKLVLIKSDFNGIVHAVLEGRRIFTSLVKSFSYLVSFHVPIVLLAFLPPALGMGDVLLPVHIIVLQLIVHPVSAFTFENHPSMTKRKGRELMTRFTLITSILSGFLVTIAALVPFIIFKTTSLEEKRAFSINVILFGNIGFILLETMPALTRRLLITISLLLVSSFLIFFIPVFSNVLHLAPIQYSWFFACLLLGIFSSIPAFLIRSFRKT